MWIRGVAVHEVTITPCRQLLLWDTRQHVVCHLPYLHVGGSVPRTDMSPPALPLFSFKNGIFMKIIENFLKCMQFMKMVNNVYQIVFTIF